MIFVILTEKQVTTVIENLEARGIPVTFGTTKDNVGGYYNLEEHFIVIDKSKGDWTDTLLHEATHSVTITDSISTVEEILWFEIVAYFAQYYFKETKWTQDEMLNTIAGIKSSTGKHCDKTGLTDNIGLFDDITYLFKNKLGEIEMHIIRALKLLGLAPTNAFPFWGIEKEDVPTFTLEEQKMIENEIKLKRTYDKNWIANKRRGE